jgi:hypothetical protein
MYRRFLLALCVAAFASGVGTAGEKTAKDLARARLELARRGLATVQRQAGGANGFYRDIWVWSERVLSAELDLSDGPAERIAALEAHLQRARRLEGLARDGFAQRIFSFAELLEAEYNRLDAEARLAAEKARMLAAP